MVDLLNELIVFIILNFVIKCEGRNMLNQFIQLEVDRRGWVVNPAMIAFFKVCKAVMIQGFTEKLKLCDIMSFGEYSSITRPLLSG